MVKDNIFKIKESIEQVCSKLGQGHRRITIVAVAKGRTVDEIRQVIDAGINDIGENKVQEALLKYSTLTPKTYDPTPIKCHMVGHLQTNKVKEAVRIFDLIHSVDSIRLAEIIDKEAQKINKIQDVLVEVKTSPEATKFGLTPEEVPEVIQKISRFKNIKICGLMTIAPLVDNPEKARPYFHQLRELKEMLNSLHITPYTLHILSMGMSDDFEVAIEEGANIVRLGRAIFGS